MVQSRNFLLSASFKHTLCSIGSLWQKPSVHKETHAEMALSQEIQSHYIDLHKKYYREKKTPNLEN